MGDHFGEKKVKTRFVDLTTGGDLLVRGTGEGGWTSVVHGEELEEDSGILKSRRAFGCSRGHVGERRKDGRGEEGGGL